MSSINTNYLTNKTYWQVDGSGTMWDGFKFGIPGLYYYYDSDFVKFVADEWTVTEVDAGANATDQLLLDRSEGWLRIKGAGNEDDGAQLQLGGTGNGETVGESFAPVANKKIFFETEIFMADATQSDFFIGLHVEDTTIIASRGADYIGFRKDDGDAALDIESCSGSSASDITSVATLVDATVIKLGFVSNGTSSIDFWINNVKANTISSDIPTELMKLSIAYLNGEAAENDININYIRCYQER